MSTTMMPHPAALETPTNPSWLDQVTTEALDALGITDHDLFAEELADETPEERTVRLVAAADILNDRLAEIAHRLLTPEVLRRWAR